MRKRPNAKSSIEHYDGRRTADTKEETCTSPRNVLVPLPGQFDPGLGLVSPGDNEN